MNDAFELDVDRGSTARTDVIDVRDRSMPGGDSRDARRWSGAMMTDESV